MLIVEDDRKTADTLALYLRHGGFRVTVSHDGADGLQRAQDNNFDVVLLDRMLPSLNGLAICQKLRLRSDVPILMLTARVAEHERLEGFDAGVDDYIVKPFSPREVVARVQAVLRRAGAKANAGLPVVRVGPLTLDTESNEAAWNGNPLQLSPTEFRLLLALAQAPARVFSREELAVRVLSSRTDAFVRTIDVHVMNLRRKVDTGDAEHSVISTVFGIGYRLSPHLTRRG